MARLFKILLHTSNTYKSKRNMFIKILDKKFIFIFYVIIIIILSNFQKTLLKNSSFQSSSESYPPHAHEQC